MPGTGSQQLVVLSLGAGERALPIAAVGGMIHCTEPRSVASDVPWKAVARTGDRLIVLPTTDGLLGAPAGDSAAALAA